MIANYGYQDGSGTYYISIDTDHCVACAHHACSAACPAGLFELMVDDYDDEVVHIAEHKRRSLKADCAGCKPVGGYSSLPCLDACNLGAIKHSW